MTNQPQTAVACPLWTEVDPRLPFWQYYELFRRSNYGFLLDSGMDHQRLGQYSFLGGEPFLVFRAKRRPGGPPQAGAKVAWQWLADADGRALDRPETTTCIADPFARLREMLRGVGRLSARDEPPPVPFQAGAVGYFGYEAGHFIEQLPDTGRDDPALPDVYLMFIDKLLAKCHRSGRTWLSVLGRGDDEDSARRRAESLRDRMLGRIEALEPQCVPTTRASSSTVPTPDQVARTRVDVTSQFDQAGYQRAVATIREHIAAGDIFQACMTQRFDAPLVGGDAWDLYQQLRRINPAPFAGYLNFPEAQVVSSSPERFLRLGADRFAESRPIKGTRPRGATPEEDAALREQLLASEKDRAENVMIVDLIRNDLGRVCQYGTVRVPELMTIEPYATVWQMVSTVRGRLCDEFDAVDLIRACFPGGSMTGAPKIQAMKILDRLEPGCRGVYSGSIGYLDFAGPMDLSIVIRTLVVKDGRCYFNAGGGIVADSQPESEYLEMLAKAKALVAALQSLKARALDAV